MYSALINIERGLYFAYAKKCKKMTRAYAANVEKRFRQKFCVRHAKKAFSYVVLGRFKGGDVFLEKKLHQLMLTCASDNVRSYPSEELQVNVAYGSLP